MAWAMDVMPGGLTPSERLALVALADFKNAKTGKCNPRVATIAAKVGLREWQTRRLLRRLECLGLVKTKFTGRSSSYELVECTSKIAHQSEEITDRTSSSSPVRSALRHRPDQWCSSTQSGALTPVEPGRETVKNEASKHYAPPPHSLNRQKDGGSTAEHSEEMAHNQHRRITADDLLSLYNEIVGEAFPEAMYGEELRDRGGPRQHWLHSRTNAEQALERHPIAWWRMVFSRAVKSESTYNAKRFGFDWFVKDECGNAEALMTGALAGRSEEDWSGNVPYRQVN